MARKNRITHDPDQPKPAPKRPGALIFLNSVEDVVAHLGGPTEVAKLTGRVKGAVHNWRALERFSAKVYVVMTEALRRRGAIAPPELWGQEGTTEKAA